MKDAFFRVLVAAAIAGAGFALLVSPAAAEETAGISAGDTAWLISATALVLLMTLPGLCLFYAGLVHARNVLSVLLNCFAIACLASVLWLIVGYTLAFGDGGAANPFIGGFGKAFLAGVGLEARSGSVPESVFFMFQMTFAIITPALIVGAYVERIRFSAVLLFSGLWLLLVYAPLAHWIWGGGWLAELGVMDFAGGLVVHLSCGISALVLVLMLGNRRGFPREIEPPHSPVLTLMGGAMLWVGWFGFNAGSALAANGNAGMAMVTTHIAAAAAALTWMVIEWSWHGKPTLVGTVTGTIAGLATITPASGFVGPPGALILGIAAGIVCYNALQWVKQRLRIDDALDVFAVHGVGGAMGILFTPILAVPAMGGLGLGVPVAEGVLSQLIGIGATLVWGGGLSFVILLIVRALVGLRVSGDEEQQGLDVVLHGERGYRF